MSMLFRRDAVPPKIVVDNYKEQSLGKFSSECIEADCQLVNKVNYYPYMMTDKGFIKHLKQGLSRKMLKSESPKQLWDHCIELEALIFLNTALDVYGIEGQVPKTLMIVKTADISNICKYVLPTQTGISQ